MHFLINEFKSGHWTQFQAAVAFARQSGNYVELIEAMRQFAKEGGTIDLTFGADTFPSGARGSQYDAIDTLLSELGHSPRVRIHLYHETTRTFHPKVYLFANTGQGRALLIVGSSNWSAGGFHENVEANVAVRLDLHNAQHRQCYEDLVRHFSDYWQDPE